MATSAIYVEGGPVLPQARTTTTIDWVYVEGQLGGLTAPQAVTVTVAPGAGAVEIAGQAPATPQTVLISPTAGAVTLTAAAPVLSGSATIAVPVGSVALAGAAPSLVEVSGAQYARPINDAGTGAWLPSEGITLYGCIDETVADDGDYIYSSATPDDDIALVNLTALSTPGAGTVTLRVRAKAA